MYNNVNKNFIKNLQLTCMRFPGTQFIHLDNIYGMSLFSMINATLEENVAEQQLQYISEISSPNKNT